MQIAEDLNGIIVTGNVVVALRWNGNSETWNKETELNTFWFWEKVDWQAWVEDLKRHLLDFTGRGKRWDVWEGAQAGFKSLDLMTEGVEKEQLLRSERETEMRGLGVVGILGLENFEWQKERFEAEFAKELDEIVGETQKLETDTGLTETGKIWDFEWSSTKFDFGVTICLVDCNASSRNKAIIWIRRKR